MKNIYFVLTYTGTFLSKVIKFYTRKKYSHVSISLDEDLKNMYSFGRLNAYNPFKGGFIHEYIDKGTFKRFKNTKCTIYSYEITEESYKLLEKEILDMYKQKEKYKFNLLGLLAVSINKKVNRENYFYCAEFAKYILQKCKIDVELPEIVKPEDFENIEGIKQIYKGYLRDYRRYKKEG